MLYAIIAVGVAGAGVYAAVMVFQRVINAPVMAKMVQKLVQAENVDRAIKLCKAAPNAPFAVGVLAALTEVRHLEGTTKSRDEIGEHLREAFGATFNASVEDLKLARSLGWLSMLSGVALAAPMVVFFGRPTVHMIASVAAVAVGAFAVTSMRKIDRGPQTFEPVLEALVAMLDAKRSVGDGAFRSSVVGAPSPPAREAFSVSASPPEESPPPVVGLRCASCGHDELSELSGDKLERLRASAPADASDDLRARVCRRCGRVDWYVDPATL